MSGLAQLMRKVRLMISTGIVRLTNDGTKIQQLQCSILDGEVRDKVNRMQDYGFTSRPLDGAEVLLAAVGGNRDHLIAVRVDDGRNRKKGLSKGEVSMYTDEGDYILMRRGRIVDVVSGTKVKVTAPEVEIIASSKVTVTSPQVDMSGNLTVTGIITGGTVKQGSVVLGSHVHSGVQPGGSNTGGPV